MIDIRTNPHFSNINTNLYKAKYSGINDLEIAILYLKENNYPYSQIQKLTGNPSKKIIRNTILKYKPELLQDTEIKKSSSTPQKRIIGLLCKFNKYTFNLEEFGECTFSLNNNNISWKDKDGIIWEFDDFDRRTQLSILYNIAEELNIDIKSNEFN